MTNPNDDTMAPVWTSVRVLLLAVGGVMLDQGFTTSSPAYHYVMIGSGAVSIVGPAVWGVWVAITRAARARQAQAKAVQAGVNLVFSGQALTTDGQALTVAHPTGATIPPLPVTEKTASEIVKNFAPTEAPKAV